MTGVGRSPYLKWLGTLVFGMLLSGCSTVRPPLNEPLNPPSGQVPLSAHSPSYRLQNLASGHGNSDHLLVVLTFSGGGARAAAFAYGVLNELKNTSLFGYGVSTNLFDEVDVVAGVSGGSIAAAYLAAFGDGIFRDFETAFLKADFQGALLARTRDPGNVLQLSSPWFGRGHLLAEQLDESLFRGMTFGDLAARRTRPFVLITATDLTQGTGFEFSQDQFDILCSHFDQVPLAVAVAASSAVPLVLSPLTVRNFAGSCAPTPRSPHIAATAGAYLDAEKRPFIHLVDGGLSDNLAVRWIIDNIEHSGGMAGPIEQSGFRDVDKLVVINVNASQGLNTALDRSDRIPSIAEVIDAVSSANLVRRSRETQDMLAASTAQWRDKLRVASRSGSPALAASIDLYVIDVSLEAHADPRLREELLAMPTALSLPHQAVDKLIVAGRTVLRDSAEFKRLLRELPANSEER